VALALDLAFLDDSESRALRSDIPKLYFQQFATPVSLCGRRRRCWPASSAAPPRVQAVLVPAVPS